MAKMSVDTLQAVVQQRIENSVNYIAGSFTQDRIRALNYYYGEPFGNEVVGQSQVVSRDVAEAIDSVMPALMKVFASGDKVCEFQPQGPEDEEIAEQATDYVNWIFSRQNPGFSILHTCFKDALLQRLGVGKAWWEEVEEVAEERYEGLTPPQLEALEQDETLKLMDQTAGVPFMDPQSQKYVQTINAVFNRTNESGRVRIMAIPPEEFLFERRTVDPDDASFLAHRSNKTASELVQMGYKKSLIDGLPTDEILDLSQERINRFKKEDGLYDYQQSEMDDSMREIVVTECYMQVDFDGDGIAEMRKITVAGSSEYVVLDNEAIDDHPFFTFTPVPMPHTLIGVSLADQTMDIQLIKSTIERQMLNNLYLTNSPQLGVVEGQVNLDDVLTRRPGGIIRMKNPNAIVPIPNAGLGQEPYSMLQFLDQEWQFRTGTMKTGSGLDADAINPMSATQVNRISEKGAERIELIARVFAETGVKRLFKRILELCCKHQQQAKIIKLRNKWVQMDPREWRNDYDATVSVGLGTGNKDQQIAHITTLLNLDEKIIQLQGGLDGPLVTAKDVYAKLAKLVEAVGLKTPELYYTDPSQQQDQPPKPPKPDPKMAEVQGKLQLQQQEMQADQQGQQARAQADAQADAAKAAADIQIQRERIAAESKAKQEQLLAEMALKREQMLMEVQLKREQMQWEAATRTHISGQQVDADVRFGGDPG